MLHLLRVGVGGLLVLCGAASAWAFNGHQVSEGPLTLLIEPLATVTALDAPQTAVVRVSNTADHPLTVDLELKGLVDECRAVGPARKQIAVPAKGAQQTEFQFALGRGTHSALYPLHVHAASQDAGGPLKLHAVLVFETDLRGVAQNKPDWPLNVVPQRGVLPLAAQKTQRMAWNYLDQPPVTEPAGWEGTSEKSAASLRVAAINRGTLKDAIQMHPPYRGGKGAVFAEYRLKLPPAGPISLQFFTAIRDTSAKEPPSDGVTFRVWAGADKLFERHSDAKQWTPGTADLSRYAGREIVLRLESHPGPKLNTTCDQSFWGEPTIVAGTPPAISTAQQRAAMVELARTAAARGKSPAKNVLLYKLDSGCWAAVALGPCGLTDGALAFGGGDKVVAFEGLQVAIGGQPVGGWPSSVLCNRVDVQPAADGKTRVVHRLSIADQAVDMPAVIWADGGGLRIKIEAPEGITDIAPGAADQIAPRVYYGHGYAIEDPEGFRASPGGHNLSTGHVGFDFQRGVSLVMAADTPVDALLVDPPQKLYALHVHPQATFTFVPSFAGALDAAIRYRPLFGKQAAPGVAKKAGRFTFDIWGGRYADNAELLARAFDYGLTDALVILHSWQRWGYDYRLPDIFPPDPKQGTLKDMQRLAAVCRQSGVLFGLHDNYIDFYPDADDFSYEHITFTPQGMPRKAWINYGRDAQSYQFRPDHIRPFVERNLQLVKQNIDATAYFVDVFASINSFDYYDRQGRFHSKLETQRAWAEGFNRMREILGNNAPTTSEAGGDHLIGALDGADCQVIRLVGEPRRYTNRLACRQWDLVPWFDAVNHTRFSLHGVGYSNRYQGGRSRFYHGIDSDDYLTAELLTGHCLMIDRTGLVREAVRKHWLAQEIVRRLATDEIAQVEMVDGDIHRVAVTWKSGARVLVNRGPSDWIVEGHCLPTYGYWARSGDAESSIEVLHGAVVERSQAPTTLYVNGRGDRPSAALAVRPQVERLEPLGGRKFKLHLAWDVKQPPAGDLAVYMHFYQTQISRSQYIGWSGATGKPKLPTSKWTGRVSTGNEWTVTVPANCPAGRYEILVGLLDQSVKPPRRVRVQGDEDSDQRVHVGTLVVEGKKDEVTGVKLEPAAPFVPPSRPETNVAATDFGGIKTTAGLRCQIEPQRLRITPLPDSKAAEIELRLPALLGRPATVKGLWAVDARGEKTRAVESPRRGLNLLLSTRPGEFGYVVELE